MNYDIPSFQEFIEAMNGNLNTLFYDIERFSYDRMLTPGNPFSKEEYELITQTVLAMNLALLAQYHSWLADRIGEK